MMEIVLEDITKYLKRNKVLDNLSLKINEGSLVLFIGENGSGKSTTLKLINNFIKIRSKDKGKLSNGFSNTSFLPDKYILPPFSKVLNFIALFSGFKDKILILKKMNDYGVMNKRIGTLSKGMLQKVGIISTLLVDADIYFFDEPVDGLDACSKKQFKEDIKNKLVQGKTIVIATHYRSFFKEMNAIIYKFKNGRIEKK